MDQMIYWIWLSLCCSPDSPTFAKLIAHFDGAKAIYDADLKDISRIIADCGGNVTGVHYEKGNTESVNGCYLRIEMETRDFSHVNLITQSLRNEGFKIV